MVFRKCLVMSWCFIHSTQITRSFLLLGTGYDIQRAANTYSRDGNDTQIYELQKEVHGSKQKGSTVFAYYTLWHDLNYYQDFQIDCAVDFAKFMKMIDKKEYIFFSGTEL